MNSRERVIKTLNHQEVDRIPRNLWALPGISLFRKEELDKVLKEYPSDIINPNVSYGASHYSKGNPNEIGEYVDEWGCTFTVLQPGIIGEVKETLLNDLSDIENYQLPWEIINNADFYQVNKSCAESDKFVLAGTQIRPFERMQFLRGTENLFMDIALEEPEFLRLLEKLHEFFIKEITIWADTDVDGISIMDDWGTQNSLLISPKFWRKYFKPLYKEYADIAHKKGKFIFMHSDGNIESIYPDLVEIGIDAINSQIFCMNIEELGNKYSGKITFWGEIDRQFILPFGTKEDVQKAVDRAAVAFMPKIRTGIIAQCEWGLNDPVENIIAVFEQWDKH